MISTFKERVEFSKFFLVSFLLLGAWGIPSSGRGQELAEEKELEVVNFKKVKEVLKQDGLLESSKNKVKKVKAIKAAKAKIQVKQSLYPTTEEFWGFISEYWLVKNAQLLVWDFERPDYGLEKSFRSILEKLGFYQKSFKLLLLNTPQVVRASLPSGPNELIYLVSLPFVRSMDLSKLEISLLMLEDFLRHESGYFKDAVRTEKMQKLLGASFTDKRPDLSLVEEVLKKYDQQIKLKGYTFQQQFELTKKMDAYLKPHPELWNAYFQLLGKIGRFLKTNVQYKDYVKLYPSPEMQLKWLSPEEKVL